MIRPTIAALRHPPQRGERSGPRHASRRRGAAVAGFAVARRGRCRGPPHGRPRRASRHRRPRPHRRRRRQDRRLHLVVVFLDIFFIVQDLSQRGLAPDRRLAPIPLLSQDTTAATMVPMGAAHAAASHRPVAALAARPRPMRARGLQPVKCGMTCSPHWRIVSRHAACGTVPIWMRHMISSAPASASRSAYSIASWYVP